MDSLLLHVICMTYGVPQESALDLLPLFICVDELPNLSRLLSFYLFADDTNIYFESDGLTGLVKIANKELKRVEYWLDCNKLALNIDKLISHSFIHLERNNQTK